MSSNSSAVAREALRQLASKRLPPTPDNYTRIYHEIASPGAQPGVSTPVAVLREFADALSKRHPEGGGDANSLGLAVDNGDWESAKTTLLKIVSTEPSSRREAGLWGQLINDLLRQIEVRTPGITRARKREMLDHALTAFSGNSEALYARLRGVMRAWTDAPRDAPPSAHIELLTARAAERAEAGDRIGPSARLATLAPRTELDTHEKLIAFVRELLANTLTFGVVERLGYSFELAREARELADQVRAATTPEAIGQLGGSLKHFWIALEIRGDDQREILQCLLRLLNGLCGNIGELVGDDAWLRGQLKLIETLTSGPIDRASLVDLERGLREVMFKQGTLKHSLDQARDALKNMVATFIDRLSEMADDTGGFHDRMSSYAAKIASAENISELSDVVSHVMQDTRNVQASMQRSRDELLATRKQVDDCQVRIVSLQQELVSVSDRLHEDQLTNLLNRRGLGRAFDVEAARADRRQEAMSVSILDIDNFKQLNDSLGHKAGDLALVHLAGVVRQSIRPTDIISRYGGEEFVILLPETPISTATQVMARVQRELTRKFFLHNNERVLITFSAGVAQRRAGETQDDVLVRADRALYQAKQSGKNRVIAE